MPPVIAAARSTNDLPTPKLKAYPREGVVSESLKQRSVSSQDFSFDGIALSEAIKNTFAARKTELPRKSPVAFTSEFFDDADKEKQWAGFCNKNRAYVDELSLEAVCKELAKLLRSVVGALVNFGIFPKSGQKATGAVELESGPFWSC